MSIPLFSTNRLPLIPGNGNGGNGRFKPYPATLIPRLARPPPFLIITFIATQAEALAARGGAQAQVAIEMYAQRDDWVKVSVWCCGVTSVA